MRKVGWRWRVILFLMLAGLFCPVKVHAEETDSYLSELSVPSSRNSFFKKKSHGSLFSPMTNSMTCLSFYDCYSILFLHSLRCRKS